MKEGKKIMSLFKKTNPILNAAAKEMLAAINSGDKEKQELALQKYGQAVADIVMEQTVTTNSDASALASRGSRVLTSQETTYYQTLIDAGLSENPKQYLMGLPDPDAKVMPVTIIEDVFKHLKEDYSLLSRINFQSVEYLTRWIFNDHSKQPAHWGAINSQIAAQISSAFRVIEMVQCKLSAFALIEKDMLKLGPTFLDAYIRTFLTVACAEALESAVVSGDGANKPIGIDRDVHQGVAVTQGAYPQKEAIAVTSFAPAEYGQLLSKLAITEIYYTKDEDGKVYDKETATNEDGSTKEGFTKHGGYAKKFDEVTLVCNQVDYLSKIMPATTVQNLNGTYTNNVFPFPTNVEISTEVETGKAVIFLPEEYFAGLGMPKEGAIEYSDEARFLEDQRAYIIKLYANATPYDNTCAILIDISNLDPAFITINTNDIATV